MGRIRKNSSFFFLYRWTLWLNSVIEFSLGAAWRVISLQAIIELGTKEELGNLSQWQWPTSLEIVWVPESFELCLSREPLPTSLLQLPAFLARIAKRAYILTLFLKNQALYCATIWQGTIIDQLSIWKLCSIRLISLWQNHLLHWDLKAWKNNDTSLPYYC